LFFNIITKQLQISIHINVLCWYSTRYCNQACHWENHPI